MLDTRMRSSRNPVLRYPIRVYQSDRASPTDTLTTDSPGKQRGAVGVAPRRRLTLPLDKLHYISDVPATAFSFKPRSRQRMRPVRDRRMIGREHQRWPSFVATCD